MRSCERIFGIVSWNSWILFFSSASCSAVTPHWPWIRHSGLRHVCVPICRCWSGHVAVLPPPLSVASPFHTAGGGKAPPGLSGTVSPGHFGTRWSGQILPLAGLKETKESSIQSAESHPSISSGLSSVNDTLLLLSSRHLEMMVSRNTSWAAMMWSRSWARCTLFQSSSQEHSKTCTQ